MAKWFYLVDGQEIGPIESRQLQMLAASRRLTRNDLVRREDMVEWYQAAHLTGLFVVAQPSSPLSSSPPPSQPVSQSQPSPGGGNYQKIPKTPWLQSAIALCVVAGYFLLCGVIEALFGSRASGVMPLLAEIAIAVWVVYWLVRRLLPQPPDQCSPQVAGRTESDTGTNSRIKMRWRDSIWLCVVLLVIIAWACFRAYLYNLEKTTKKQVFELLQSTSQSTEDSAKSHTSVEAKTPETLIASASPSSVVGVKAELTPTAGTVPWVARTLATLSATTSNPDPHDARATYKNSAKGFSIDFPQGWTVKEPLANSEIVIKANHSGDNHKLATLLVKTAKLDLPSGTPAPTAEQFSATYFSDGRPLLNSAAGFIDGRNTYWLETKTTVIGIPAYMVSYFLVEDDTLYCLEGVIVTQDPAWIDSNAKSILRSIQSFRLTK